MHERAEWSSLSKLLEHESGYVRLWAVVYVPPESRKRAEEVLEWPVREGVGFQRHAAEVTLAEMRRGTPKPP